MLINSNKRHNICSLRAFSSVVMQMPGWNPQRWDTASTLPKFCVVLYIFCCVSFCVL